MVWFLGEVLDLYQRLLQALSRTKRVSSEQKLRDMQQNHNPAPDPAPAAVETDYALSALQPQAALQQRPKASDTMGE